MRFSSLGRGLLFSLVLVACGGGADDSAPAAAVTGTAGAGGGSAGKAGQSQGGAAGTAAGGSAQAGAGQGGGGNTAAGKGGAGAGGAGAAGTGGAGKGGGAGAGAGGAGAGGAGGAGKGGAAGGGAAGAGGQAGQAGGTACKVDGDCKAALPNTVPAGCAENFCDVNVCRVRARDADADGERGASCVANGVPIQVGPDCDDANPKRNTKAWDGPVDGAKADSCDGVDTDCDGKVDDEKAANGSTCTCTLGDVKPCSEESGGKPITFPKVDGTGKPYGKCKIGNKTCGADGKWGACVGAVGPDLVEICNGGVDDDCDGLADMQDTPLPPHPVTWSYDGDGDGYAATGAGSKVSSCADAAPAACPNGVSSCDPTKWKLGSLPAKDCDDADDSVSPASTELCDGLDNDCNGTIDDDAVGAPLWYFDYDGDNFGDIDTPPVRSCTQPTTFPSLCATIEQVAGDFCTGVAQEGAAPACPPAACTAAMWKKNLTNTDCKDHPLATDALSGNKPQLVYPGGKDLCNGRDYDCDGTPNTGCGCSPLGATQACGSATTCNAGTQVCVAPGVWGACSGGDIKPQSIYCPDDDSDTYCSTAGCTAKICAADVPAGHQYKVQTACTAWDAPANGGNDCNDGAGQVSPGATEKCGDSVDTDCDGADSNGFGIGTVCPIGTGLGACAFGGTIDCQSPGSTNTTCKTSYAPASLCFGIPVTVNGQTSWDRDCDGVEQLCVGGGDRDWSWNDTNPSGKIIFALSAADACSKVAAHCSLNRMEVYWGSGSPGCGGTVNVSNCTNQGLPGSCFVTCWEYAQDFTCDVPDGGPVQVSCH